MPKTKFPAVVELSNLDGKNGFKINGEAEGDLSGYSVSGAFDINGDGIEDLIVGAYGNNPNGASSGSTYVVFGKNDTWVMPLELSTLDGTNGFKINGEAVADFSGYSVSGAGDVNGDGIDDLIIGAVWASPNGAASGSTYVVFGKNSAWTTPLELSTLDGTNGFKINGEAEYDSSGVSVSNAGDVNGDGIDDIVIGAYHADTNEYQSGSSYVVFGYRGSWTTPLELSTLNGTNGFKINGEAHYDDESGHSVSGAGDVNGDGIDDIIIGAYRADPNGYNTGASYVVFGQMGNWTTPLELSTLNGTNGFKINGEAIGPSSGYSVSYAGDINGDGIDDLSIGAHSGSSYVVFGQMGNWTTPLELSTLDGINGLKINSEGAGDSSGFSVSYAGDINGDGIDDLIVGAPYADPHGESSGASYVVFGKNGTWVTPLDLSALDGANGFKIDGETGGDYSGYSVSGAGDINGDGIDDLIVGAPYADSNGDNSGASYIIFGDVFTAEFVANQLTIDEGETKAITLFDLNATDLYHNEVHFEISALAHGYFENINNIGDTITRFSKEDIENNDIRFVHDGSEFLPVYNVTLHTEKFACSKSSAANITFTHINDIPELTVSNSMLSYIESDPAKIIDSHLVIVDPDNNLINATITITNNFHCNQDVLGFVDQNGIHGSFDEVMGVLVLNGSSRVENYQTALRNITYKNLANSLTVGMRTITFIVHDGLENSLPVGRNISVMKQTIFPAVIELSRLDGKNGFKINGEAVGDYSGYSVSGAGDINGDGFDDLIIGAYRASPDVEREKAGSSYVILGHNGTWPNPLALSTLNGTLGFKINGELTYDFSGYSVSHAGDINGDGIDDIIIGAYNVAFDYVYSVGASYVIFGSSEAWPGILELSALNGKMGFRINGEAAYDRSGISVGSTGDIDGDGIDDIIIGAYTAAPDGRDGAGSSYIIFGHVGNWTTPLELSALTGDNGIKINGETAGDYSGFSVSHIGDINGDGIDDIVIGAPNTNPDSESEFAGSSYVIFGHNGAWSHTLELSTLNSTIGFKINGELASDNSGYSVSGAGDINGDGIDDIIIGAYGTDSNGGNSGSSYVIFGHWGNWTSPLELSSLEGTTGFKINGVAAGDRNGQSVSKAGDVNGDGIDDIIIGAYGADSNGENSGSSYVIFGHRGNWTTPLELSSLEGTTGFKVNGELAWDGSGYSVSGAGDINGDGIDDIVIGAYGADPNGESSGSSYVIFGDVFTAELVVNQLPISEGETKDITLSELNAMDDYHQEIWFAIDDLENGYFENINIGNATTLFSKEDIENNHIRFVHDGSEFSPAYTVTIHTEKLAYSKPFFANITFTGVNDAPELKMTVSALNYLENKVIAVDEAVVVSDSDSVDLTNGTVALSSNFHVGQDVLGFTDQLGIYGAYDETTGVLILIGAASVENYQTALRNVTYENLSDNPVIETRTVTIMVNDGVLNSLPATRDIIIIPMNDRPILVPTSTPLNYTENDAATVIDPGMAILDDPDHTHFSNATVSIANNFNRDEDVLGVTYQPDIIGAYNSSLGVLTLIGITSENNYQFALRNVTYENLSDNPTCGTRTIAFIVNDGLHESVLVTRDINIIPLNDRPAITNTVDALVYFENDEATIIDEDIAITDPDNFDLTNATIAITDNFNPAQDRLAFGTQTNIGGHYDNETGILTLVGSSSIAHYQATLRNVTYENLSDHPTTEIRTITFVVNDGGLNSLPAARDIIIIPINDIPILVPTSIPLNYTENDAATVIDPGIVIFDDPDHSHFFNATVSIVNNFSRDEDVLGFSDQQDIIGAYNSSMGVLTLTGIVSENNYQAALRTVTYENLSDKPSAGQRTVEFSVYDGLHESIGVTRDITIIAVNDLPVISGSTGALRYTENDPATVIDANIVVTDPDSPYLMQATVAITNHFNIGQDRLDFVNQNDIRGVYNNVTGILSLTGFSSVDDYQTALRSVQYYNPSDDPAIDIRTISFMVNDESGSSNAFTKLLQIIPENDRPLLLNNQLTITEGHNVTLTAHELSATDLDDDDADLEFIVHSVTHGQFKSRYAFEEVTTFVQRNISEGDIQFVHDGSNSAPSYFVRVSDGQLTNARNFQLVNVDFTPTNDVPVLMNNALTIDQGQHKALTSMDLSATDEETSDMELTFIVSDIQHSYFEDIQTAAHITHFTQGKIAEGDIRVVHDASQHAPSYAISVSDGLLETSPASAEISFLTTAPTENIGISNAAIGGIAGGTLGLLLLVFRLYHYYQEKNHMKSYVNGVVNITAELARQGIDVNDNKMMPAERSRIINEIAQQTDNILMPKQNCCGQFMRFFGICSPTAVKPEAVVNNAHRVALAVKSALEQDKHDIALSMPTVNNSSPENIMMSMNHENASSLEMTVLEKGKKLVAVEDETLVVEESVSNKTNNEMVPSISLSP